MILYSSLLPHLIQSKLKGLKFVVAEKKNKKFVLYKYFCEAEVFAVAPHADRTLKYLSLLSHLT